MKRKEFKPYSLIELLKKYKCPIKVLKPSTSSLSEWTFALFEGLFWIGWYMCIIGGYFYYIIGYCIYWAVATIILNIKEHKNNSHNSNITN